MSDLSLKIWRLDSLLAIAVDNQLWTTILLIVAELQEVKTLHTFFYKQVPLTLPTLASLVIKSFRGLIRQKYAQPPTKLKHSLLKQRRVFNQWPKQAIIAAVIEEDCKYLTGSKNGLKSLQSKESSWFVDFWLEVEGNADKVCIELISTYVDTVEANPSFRLALLTLREFALFDVGQPKVRASVDRLAKAIDANFCTPIMQLQQSKEMAEYSKAVRD